MSILFSFIFESKQSIVSLGFPEVIASIISQRFGKNDHLIAKWLKDSSAYQFHDKETNSPSYPENWWKIANGELFSKGLDLVDLVDLYEASKTLSLEKYNEVRKAKNLSEVEELTQEEQKMIKASIERKLFDSLFFSYETLVQDIQSGKLTDLKPYKDLSYQAAKDKYDKNRMFKQQQNVVKEYPNGWRWINAGPKCQLVGGLMKNCGSTGVMSSDPDRTMMTLFDSRNKPHVVVTYSPNEKRISGDEGVGGSAVKERYQDYVLDLADHLGVKFDFEKTKSKLLKLKGALKGKLKSIERLEVKSDFDEFFKLVMEDGSVYYTNSYDFAKEEDVKKIMDDTNTNLVSALRKALDRYSGVSVGIYKFINP